MARRQQLSPRLIGFIQIDENEFFSAGPQKPQPSRRIQDGEKLLRGLRGKPNFAEVKSETLVRPADASPKRADELTLIDRLDDLFGQSRFIKSHCHQFGGK